MALLGGQTKLSAKEELAVGWSIVFINGLGLNSCSPRSTLWYTLLSRFRLPPAAVFGKTVLEKDTGFREGSPQSLLLRAAGGTSSSSIGDNASY